MSAPLLSIREASISFAKKMIFEDLTINLFDGDKVCLIGKNGAGKTTLMNTIFGRIELDEGVHFIAPNTNIGYLEQDEKITKDVTVSQYLMENLDLDEHKEYLIDIVCNNLKIDKNQLTQSLSGGQRRRANLAKALVFEPDILLLDEPTNHLDLETIEWLEKYLNSYNGCLLIISHDREFLKKVTNKIFWLRAGKVMVNNHGYKNFDKWAGEIIDFENRKLANLEKKVELESGWLQTGVTARRKRNIGRLHHLTDLRNQLKEQKRLVNSNKNQMKIGSFKKFDDNAPQIIAAINNINKSFGEKKIISNFNLRMIRGEKIGVIGKNGAGKSTFLKLLVKQINPDSGNVKLANDLHFSYFDQERSSLKKNITIKEFLCENDGDQVLVTGDKTRHVCGYLKDFLFDPKDVDTLVATLSGGQQNRLFLAKTLANPGNFLILDEPTNDLDMESLDILEDYLCKYRGTLIVVSHDRDFLDNVATSILAFEGETVITSHLGGYSDYLEYQKRHSKPHTIKQHDKSIGKQQQKNNFASQKEIKRLKSELNKIPDKIEKVEAKINNLTNELNDPDNLNPNDIATISFEIGQLQEKIEKLEARWIELEELLKK